MVLTGTLGCGSAGGRQRPPDMGLEISGGSAGPGGTEVVVTVGPDGAGTVILRDRTAGPGEGPIARGDVSVPDSTLGAIWSAAVDGGFFALSSVIRDSTIVDGTYVRVRLRGAGRDHSVRLQNRSDPTILRIVRLVNELLDEPLRVPEPADLL